MALVYYYLHENILTLQKSAYAKSTLDLWNVHTGLFCSNDHAYFSKTELLRINEVMQSAYSLHTATSPISLYKETATSRWSGVRGDDVEREKPEKQRFWISFRYSIKNKKFGHQSWYERRLTDYRKRKETYGREGALNLSPEMRRSL